MKKLVLLALFVIFVEAVFCITISNYTSLNSKFTDPTENINGYRNVTFGGDYQINFYKNTTIWVQILWLGYITWGVGGNLNGLYENVLRFEIYEYEEDTVPMFILCPEGAWKGSYTSLDDHMGRIRIYDYDFNNSSPLWAVTWEIYIGPLDSSKHIRRIFVGPNGGVLVINWSVDANEGISGFNVIRTESIGWGEPYQVNTTFIPVKPGGKLIDYSIIDETASTDQRYYYRVEAVLSDSTSEWAGPVPSTGDVYLPVTLSSFSATQEGEFINIKWVVESESEMSGYNVYRSQEPDLNSAMLITPSIIEAENSSQVHNYQYRDKTALTNINYYYWLESVNMDGSTNHYGPITGMKMENHTASQPEIALTTVSDAFPNPFSTNVAFSLNSTKEEPTRIKIYNFKGELVETLFDGTLTKGIHQFSWSPQSKQAISSGVYLVEIKTPSTREIKKITKLQ